MSELERGREDEVLLEEAEPAVSQVLVGQRIGQVELRRGLEPDRDEPKDEGSAAD